jgi:hypothetical protein
MRLRHARWLVAFLSLVAASCGAERHPSLGSIHGSVTVAPSEVARVALTVSGPGLPAPVTVDLAPTPGTVGSWQGGLDGLAPGDGYAVSAGAYDVAGTLLYQGAAAPVAVGAGTTTLVAIVAQQVTPPPVWGNTPPRIDSVVASNTSPAPNEAVALSVAAHDPDPGATLTYSWFASGGAILDPFAPAVTWIAPGPGPQTLTVVVSDDKGASADFSFALVVEDLPKSGSISVKVSVNSWPVVSALATSPTRVDVGQTAAVSAAVSDADGDPLGFAWSADCQGFFADPASQATSFTPTAPPANGLCTLTFAASDGRGGSGSGFVGLWVGPPPQVVVGGGGTPPVAVSGPLACSTASSNTGRKVAIDAAGIVYAGMICSGQPFVAASRDAGRTFGPPAPLPFPPVVELARQGAGPSTAFAAAIDSAGTPIVAKTTDGGGTWSAPTALVGAGQAFPSQGISVATLGDAVAVLVTGGSGVLLYHSRTGGIGPFDWTNVALPAAFDDVLADARTGTLWVASDTPELHLRASLDGGATFGPQFDPPGAAYFSDWAMGNGLIYAVGSAPSSDAAFRIAVGADAPLGSTTVGGLAAADGSAMTRAVSADALGNAYVVTQTAQGVALQRIEAGAASAGASRQLGPGQFPGVVAGSGIAAVTYTLGTTVYVTVQSFGGAPPPLPAPNAIVNGSFETGDYAGWTLLETPAGTPDAGTFAVVRSGTTVPLQGTLFDFADRLDVVQSSVGLPETFKASDGSYVGVNLQNGPQNHRMYQTVSIPAGAQRLTWAMSYDNHHVGFDPVVQYVALNVRDPLTDAVLATIYKTLPGDPLVLPLTPFSADISPFAGKTVRIDLELQAQGFHLDLSFDDFRIL